MGTRSLTHIKDEDGKIRLTFYRQFDGYPSGHGKDMADFIAGKKLVNGISEPNFNGVGDFGFQLITHLKLNQMVNRIESKGIINGKKPPVPKIDKVNLESGGFYIETPGAKDCGEEFTYIIQPKDGKMEITVSEDGKKYIPFEDALKKSGD